MVKQLVLAGLIIAAAASYGNAELKGHLVSEMYTVKSGDTLTDISYQFMKKSSVKRDIREFREGIIELNYDRIFKDRYPHGLIIAGDQLEINYWQADPQ